MPYLIHPTNNLKLKNQQEIADSFCTDSCAQQSLASMHWPEHRASASGSMHPFMPTCQTRLCGWVCTAYANSFTFHGLPASRALSAAKKH